MPRTHSDTKEPEAVFRIRTRLGVSPAQARLIARLYEGEGKAVKADDLLAACTTHWDVFPDVLKVQVSKIRRRCGQDMIPSVWKVGYRLSDAGLIRVREVLAS